LDFLGLVLDGHRFRQIQKALVSTRAFFLFMLFFHIKITSIGNTNSDDNSHSTWNRTSSTIKKASA